MTSVFLDLKRGDQEVRVPPEDVVNRCQRLGRLRFNPRADEMFKERVSHSDDGTIRSWLSVVFKLAFKELWSRSATETIDVRVVEYKRQSEFVNQESESVVKLAKASGIDCSPVPQHLQVDSRYFVKWELFNPSEGEKVDCAGVPMCSDLCKDVLQRGAEVFVEMQVAYQENFGIRMENYDKSIKHPEDRIDQNGALGKEEGHIPFSHVGIGLCAWDEKKVHKNINDNERNLMRTSEPRWSGGLDIKPSRGIGSVLGTVFLGSPARLKPQTQGDDYIQKELETLKNKVLRSYELDDHIQKEPETLKNKVLRDNWWADGVPMPLVAVLDWLAYFGFGEVLSDEFVKNKIQTKEVKGALESMSINVNNVSNKSVRDQISELWFDSEYIEQLEKKAQEAEKKAQEAEKKAQEAEKCKTTVREIVEQEQGKPSPQRGGNEMVKRLVQIVSSPAKLPEKIES